MSEVESIKKALQRERQARKIAESTMEAKSLELYESNKSLKQLNASLEKEVAIRTAEIEKSAAQLNSMFHNHPIPMMVYGVSDFKFIAVNQTAIDNYGYSDAEFLTMDITNLYAKEDLTGIEAHMYTVRSGDLELENWKHIAKNGELMDVEVSSRSIDFNDQRAWLVQIKNITQRKLAEREKDATEQKYKELVETVSDLIFRCDMTGKLTYVNSISEDKTGYSKKDLTGKTIDQLVRKDYREEVRLAFEKQIANEDQSSYQEYPVITRDGREMWIGQTAQISYLNESKTEFEIIALASDITDRKRTQEAMQRSEEKYRSIIENLELGLLEVNAKDIITHAYPKFCELTGYNNEELVGKHVYEKLLPEKYHSLVKRQSNNAQLENRQKAYEVQLICKDNSKVWVLVSGAPLHTRDGIIDGSIGIFLDITEQKNTEKQLLIAKNTAEESVQSKELFMANMSHEIRTPMNAIIGMGDLLSKSSLTSKQKEFLGAIETSADNLLIIIDDILDFSKIEAGKMELSYVPVNLRKLLKDALSTVELKAESKGIMMLTEVNNTIKNYMLDPTRLRQVLLNLLSNAVKFTDIGSVQLNCDITSSEGENDIIRFSIKDTGIGIAQEKLENIFESFIQADENTAHKYGGTGLGLSISKQLVHLMGGELKINSELTKGSEFYFEISCKKIDKIEEKTNDEILNNSSKLEQVRVLLVEDHEINRFMAQTILENWKCHVITAVNGLEAVEKVRHEKIDLILMDIRMPEMDGLQATKAIRTELCSTIPIIGLTANAIKGDKEKCIEVGMNDYVSKPFKQEDLMSKMIKYLDLEKAEMSEVINEKVESMKEENIVDLTILKSSTNGDKTFMRKMIELFLQDTPKQMADLSSAVTKNDWATVSKVAHRMKPSIDHLANVEMQKVVRQVEGVMKSEHTIEVLVSRYQKDIDRLIVGLQEEL